MLYNIALLARAKIAKRVPGTASCTLERQKSGGTTFSTMVTTSFVANVKWLLDSGYELLT